MTDVTVPALGQGIEKAQLTYWYAAAGDTVQAGQDLAELTTDKAAFNLPCPCSGVLAEILRREGDTVSVGELICRIQTSS